MVTLEQEIMAKRAQLEALLLENMALTAKARALDQLVVSAGGCEPTEGQGVCRGGGRRALLSTCRSRGHLQGGVVQGRAGQGRAALAASRSLFTSSMCCLLSMSSSASSACVCVCVCL